MFSSQNKGAAPSAFFSGFGADQHDKKHSNKPLSAKEKYEMAVVTANVFVEDSKGRVTKEMEAFRAVANSSYWFYGYFAGNAVVGMAACLAIGNRISFFRSWSGFIALVMGYGGATVCQGVHNSYLLSNVVKQIDKEVREAKRLDVETQHIVPDYGRQAAALTEMKYDLMPQLPEAIEHRAAHNKNMSVDERVDELVNAYIKKKEALNKK